MRVIVYNVSRKDFVNYDRIYSRLRTGSSGVRGRPQWPVAVRIRTRSRRLDVLRPGGRGRLRGWRPWTSLPIALFESLRSRESCGKMLRELKQAKALIPFIFIEQMPQLLSEFVHMFRVVGNSESWLYSVWCTTNVLLLRELLVLEGSCTLAQDACLLPLFLSRALLMYVTWGSFTSACHVRLYGCAGFALRCQA
jgi:hypothetical protein